jgi:hypothetical protein
MDEWCEQRDWVYDDKIHRCSVCGRRLKPQEIGVVDFIFRLPKHKKKGYKIKRKKGHNRRKNKRG